MFDRICREGEPAILAIIESRMVESVSLEFKAKEDATNGRFSKDDRARFGQILSGFANSSGGLAIWGIDARKNDEGIDCAHDRVPIDNIAIFHSESQTLCGQLLMPRHDGVALHYTESKLRPGSGYLLVNVERSERRPHRCEASGKKQYFKRAGDSFFEMEHYDIEDAFKRLTSPDLVCIIRPFDAAYSEQDEHRNLRITFKLTLTNPSGVMCRFPYLEIRSKNQMHVVGPFSLPQRPEYDGWRRFSGGADDAIHSEQTISMGEFYINHSDSFLEQKAFNIEIRFRCGGDGMRRKEGVFRYEDAQVAEFFRKLGKQFS